MLDIQSRLARLQRPKILINAARFGLDDYTRGTHLSRISKNDPAPKPGPAIMQLLEIEYGLNEERLQKRSTYFVARHVDVMIALMAEAQALQASQRVR
jgi:hypothetical protein